MKAELQGLGLAALMWTLTMNAAGSAHSDTSTAAAADAETWALIEERCTRCHVIDIVTARRATPTEWHEIVERMVSQGAQVTPEEIEAIVGYLARHQGAQSAGAQ
jgi:cytochrome c2